MTIQRRIREYAYLRLGYCNELVSSRELDAACLSLIALASLFLSLARNGVSSRPLYAACMSIIAFGLIILIISTVWRWHTKILRRMYHCLSVVIHIVSAILG